MALQYVKIRVTQFIIYKHVRTRKLVIVTQSCFQFQVYGKQAGDRDITVTVKGCVMAHPHHCVVTQKLQSTYFNGLYAHFIISRKKRIIRVFYYWT